MMRRTSVGILGSLLLTGCTTHLPDQNATIKVDAITFAILTELYCAAKDIKGRDTKGYEDITPYFGSQDNWIAAVEFYLSASIEASANPSVSLLGPFSVGKAVPVGGSTGSFTTSIGGSFDETRTKLQQYKIYVNLKQLLYGTKSTDANKNTLLSPNWEQYAESNHWPVRCDEPNAGGTYLQGTLGLKAWLEPAVQIQEATIRYAPLNPPAVPPPPPPPTISAIYPSSGSVSGGYQVTIIGTNLDNVTDVSFMAPLQLAQPGTRLSTKSTNLVVTVPASPKGTEGIADVLVKTKAGDVAATKFTYIRPPPGAATADNQSSGVPSTATGAAASPASGGAQQSPTISGQFTFVIKSAATFGPSFTLSRVSGGSGNLLQMTRTDNNYVNIALTATTYCPLSSSVPTLKGCVQSRTSKASANTTANDQQNAIARLDSALLNLNLSRIVVP